MLAAIVSLSLAIPVVIGAMDLTYRWTSAQKYPLQTAHYRRQGPSFFIQEDCPPDCPKKVMILSLDGGGIKGIVLARMLEHIERRAGKPINQLFDYIAGTSTGSIVTSGLVIPNPQNPRHSKYMASDIVNLYEVEGREIFKKNRYWSAFWGVLGPKYDADSFTGLAQHYSGPNLTLSQVITPIVLTAYNTVERTPFLFSSLDYYDGKKDNFVWQAGRASAAAPILFPAEKVDGHMLRDGCLVANNPSFIGYKKAKELFSGKSVEDFIIVSLGTGKRATKHTDPHLGFRNVLDVVGDFIYAQMERDEADLRAKFKDNYIRIEPEIEDKNAVIDNTATQNLYDLISVADKIMRNEKLTLDYLIEIWDTQDGKHVSSFDRWRELKLRVVEKCKIKPEEITRAYFNELCKKLKLTLSDSYQKKHDPFSYDLFFERLDALS